MSQTRQPYNNVRRSVNRCNQIDTHEILKAEIYKQGGDTSYEFNSRPSNNTPSNNSSIPRPLPPPSNPSDPGHEDSYLYFDSLQKAAESDIVNGEIKYAISSTYNQKKLENVVQIKIGRFYFPRISNPAGTPDYFFNRRLYLCLANLGQTQAVLAPNANYFHFEFEIVNLNSIAIEVVPINDTIYFPTPITSIDTLVFRFLVPNDLSGFLKKVPLPADQLTIQAVAGSNPAQFDVLNDTTASIGAVGVPTSPGVAAYLTGFSSADVTLNNAVNNETGFYITNINSATRFTIASLDFSGLATSPICKVYVLKNRIATTVRFTSLKPSSGNGVKAVHI